MVSLVILKIIVHKLISIKIVILMLSIYTIPNLRHCGSIVAHTCNTTTYVTEAVESQAWGQRTLQPIIQQQKILNIFVWIY